MKSNYLLWSVGLGLLSGLAFSQNAYISGNAKVKIEANTLVYFGQNFELTTAASANKTVENAGNIKIDGSFKNSSSNGENFVSTWTDADNYGQVIINDANPSAGQWLSMEKGKIDPNDFDWGQFSVPFHYNNVTDAMNNLFGFNGYPNSGNRYKSPMMVWNNDKFRFDHLETGDNVKPGDYVILNLVNSSSGILPVMSGSLSTPLLYKGVPANEKHMSFSMDPSVYPTSDWSVWRNQSNFYGEKYKTYIDDKIRVEGSDDDFGKYYFQFGNPYTSNIDLVNTAESFSNLRGVAQMTGTEWVNGTGQVSQGMVKATYDSGTSTWAGFKGALIVKPFEPFLIVLNDASDNPSFDFNDDMKTFAMEVGTSGNWDPLVGGKSGQTNNPTVSEGVNGDFYQLVLRLYDDNGEATGNRVAIAVTSTVENGEPNALEAEYYEFDGTGFYLAQERADGGHVTSSARKMDINTVNTDFVAKPIPMLFDRQEGDTTSYKIKAELFEGSIFNDLKINNENFSDGNSFYIYDNETDELAEIKNGSVFQIHPIPVNGSKNRYEVYWNEGPSGKMGTGDQNLSSTIVYKNNDSHYVRFNDNWVSAEVKVYDLTGRNIITFDNVTTKTDLEINLPGRGVYAVKVVANTGEVYTQKIIK